MNSRERVQALLQGKIPDRVPIDIGATRTTSMSIFSYVELKKYLKVEGEPPKVFDVYQMLPLVELSIAQRLHTDVIIAPRFTYKLKTTLSGWKSGILSGNIEVLFPSDFNPTVNEAGDWIITEDNGIQAKMPKNGYYFDYLESTYANEYIDVSKIQFETWGEEDFSFIERNTKQLFESTSKAIIGDFAIGLGHPLSYEEWMIALVAEQQYIKEYYDKKSDHIIKMLQPYKQAVKNNIDIIYFGQDFGTQNGELMSNEMFKDLFFPYYHKIFSWIHKETSWKVFLHTCGSIYNLLPLLIECGVDIVNPVQTSAANMDPRGLKDAFGDKIIFWGGGVDTQNVLPFGSEEDVEEQVKERIEILGKNGGYVFNPIHNIQKDVPPENIVACFDAAYEAGSELYG